MADLSFLTRIDEAVADLSARERAIERVESFFARVFSRECPGPPKLEELTTRQLAFLLVLEERYDDLLEYLQLIWDHEFNSVPTRADDEPKLAIGAVHGISVPGDGAEEWELDLEPRGSYSVVTHGFAGWQVQYTHITT